MFLQYSYEDAPAKSIKRYSFDSPSIFLLQIGASCVVPLLSFTAYYVRRRDLDLKRSVSRASLSNYVATEGVVETSSTVRKPNSDPIIFTVILDRFEGRFL